MDTVVPAGTPAHLFDPSYSDRARCVVCSQDESHPIHIQKELGVADRAVSPKQLMEALDNECRGAQQDLIEFVLREKPREECVMTVKLSKELMERVDWSAAA